MKIIPESAVTDVKLGFLNAFSSLLSALFINLAILEISSSRTKYLAG